jgi:MerR family mercuric resistance operon transcriptional regulator
MVRSQAITALTIAGLARAGGVGVETVRYYQRRGLLATPARSRLPGAPGIRRYGAEAVQRLRFIRSAQASGFTLDEIKELLTLDGRKNRRRAREIAQARIRDLDEKIAAMAKARRALMELARACESGKGRCPIIPVFD